MNDEITGLDITNRYVVLKEDVIAPAYRDVSWRVFKAESGFGIYPFTSGTAVFGFHVRDGERARWERYQIERFATDEEVAEATAKRKANA